MKSNEKESYGFLLIVYQIRHPLLLTLIPFLVVSSLVGWIYKHFNIVEFDLSFFFGTSGEYSFQIIDGIIFVSMAILSSVIIVLTLKYGLERFLKLFFSIGLFLSPVSMLWLHGYLLDIYINNGSYWFEIIFASIGVILGTVVIWAFVFNKGSKLLRNGLIIVLGIILGSIFGLLLSLATYLTLIILISLFDIYSVFKGPINKMMQKTNLSYGPISPLQKKETAIGMGDFIFYSSLIVFTSTNFGLAIGFAAILGLSLGVLLTEKLLMKFGKFPGLPLPIILSLTYLGLGYLISAYLSKIII